jgi:hypothetical protein
MVICSMGLWELTWWEIVAFVIIFGVVVYLIIKAPSSPDLTTKHTSCKSISSEDTSDKPTLHDKSTE